MGGGGRLACGGCVSLSPADTPPPVGSDLAGSGRPGAVARYRGALFLQRRCRCGRGGWGAPDTPHGVDISHSDVRACQRTRENSCACGASALLIYVWKPSVCSVSLAPKCLETQLPSNGSCDPCRTDAAWDSFPHPRPVVLCAVLKWEEHSTPVRLLVTPMAQRGASPTRLPPAPSRRVLRGTVLTG